MEKELSKGLREIDAEGFIRFSIKAKDTEENEEVHKAFKEFCKIEADDNYTVGLRILLQNFEEDYKFASLSERLDNQAQEILMLREMLSKEEKDEEGVF